VFCAAVAIAAAVIISIRPSAPVTPLRLAVLNDILAGRSIAYTPYSVGYPAFAACAIRLFGTHGWVAAQGILYVATVLLSFATLCGLGVTRRAAFAGALTVALYPTILFTVTKFGDTGVSCFLLSMFAFLLMRLKTVGLTVLNTAIAGALFGVILLVRPNAITLAPLTIWVAFHGRRGIVSKLAHLAGASVVALAIAAAIIIPLKGHLVIFDRYYGAYTFANGTHEHALGGMLHDYNGELAMPKSMKELGLPFYGLDRNDPAVADQYMHVGWNFIREHPFRYGVLEAFKVINLFRPDYRNVEMSFVPAWAGRAVHTIIAALFVVWAALRWRCRHLIGASGGLLVIPLLVLYFAPFVATNTDPRYRVPMDVVLIIDSVLCLSILWSGWCLSGDVERVPRSIRTY
jgi:hypothetical protein